MITEKLKDAKYSHRAHKPDLNRTLSIFPDAEFMSETHP
jgi:hypothetical protein